MTAQELVDKLQNLINTLGDKEIVIEDGTNNNVLEVIDVVASYSEDCSWYDIIGD